MRHRATAGAGLTLLQEFQRLEEFALQPRQDLTPSGSIVDAGVAHRHLQIVALTRLEIAPGKLDHPYPQAIDKDHLLPVDDAQILHAADRHEQAVALVSMEQQPNQTVVIRRQGARLTADLGTSFEADIH